MLSSRCRLGTLLVLLAAASGRLAAEDAAAVPEEGPSMGGPRTLGGGLFFGGPLGASALAEVVVGLRADVEDEDTRVKAVGGLALQAHAGTGGGKLSLGVVGRAKVHEEDFRGTVGAGLKVSFLRTWGDPVGTAPGVSYLGPELDLDLKRVALGLGVLWRVGGQGGSSAVFSWSLGFRL